MSRLYPVILAVSAEDRHVPARERGLAQSHRAREALVRSCEASGVAIGPFVKDAQNVPMPFDRTYWSISHKPQYVAGVVAPGAVGIDLEEIVPRKPGLFNYIAGEAEWAMSPHRDWDLFFRYWTAKEAVLKATGIGLIHLRKAYIHSIIDAERLIVLYQDRLWPVRQRRFSNHIVSVTHDDDVVWVLPM